MGNQWEGKQNMNKKHILCTGGSGFLGLELLGRLTNEKVVVVSRSESELVHAKELYPNIEIVVGDIADPFVCDKVCRDAKAIFHLAAMKHIGLAEKDVSECIKSNVIGSMNLLECTRKYKPNFIIATSTDKTAHIMGVYGATKFLMERLFKEYEQVNPDTQYRIVRYGNVLGSSGSVITKWKPLMEQNREIIITNPEATRFFWSVKESIDFIFECLEKCNDATPYIPTMKAISIGRLAKLCMDKYGQSPIKEIGLQAGENMHETMDGKLFSDQVEQYTDREFIEKFL